MFLHMPHGLNHGWEISPVNLVADKLFKVDNIPALDCSRCSIGGCGLVVYILKDEKIIEIANDSLYNKEGTEIFEKIISTFKFTK